MSTQNPENKKIRAFDKTQFYPLKYTHIASSIILILDGATILIGSLLIRERLLDYKKFIEHYINVPILVLLIGAVAIIALGWLGAIVAWQDCYRGIVTLSALIFLLVVLSLAGSIYLYYSLGSLNSQMLRMLEDMFNNYPNENEHIDTLQSQLQCCGLDNYKDWENLLGYIPRSCCKSKDICNDSTEGHIEHDKGCYKILNELIYFYTVLLFVFIIITEGLFVLSLALSYFFGRALTRQEQAMALLTKKDEHSSIPNNSLAHASAPPESADIGLSHPGRHYAHQSEQSAPYNFWSPVVQEYTARSEIPNYAALNRQLWNNNEGRYF